MFGSAIPCPVVWWWGHHIPDGLSTVHSSSHLTPNLTPMTPCDGDTQRPAEKTEARRGRWQDLGTVRGLAVAGAELPESVPLPAPTLH